MDIKATNQLILSRLSRYLNDYGTYINQTMIDELLKAGVDQNDVFDLILFNALGFEYQKDRDIYDAYFANGFATKLDIDEYKNNDYYLNITIDSVRQDLWQYSKESFKPYEAFVYNDLVVDDKGFIHPKIGYFTTEYFYPCVKQTNREWMLITPNEINTMKKPIEKATGKVLTYGLGLGYYAYMVSNKAEVISVTIVDNDPTVITLFKNIIQPQFRFPNKIRIVECDAFTYEKNREEEYDNVFVDIWHDPSDGVELYQRFKKLERKNNQYDYWIEDTLKYYL